MASFRPPDVLVLGGGGVLGEAWMSALLAGIEDASGFDPRDCSGFVGTSAGSIVAAGLGAGVRGGDRLRELPGQRAAHQPGPGTSHGSLAGRAPRARGATPPA